MQHTEHIQESPTPGGVSLRFLEIIEKHARIPGQNEKPITYGCTVAMMATDECLRHVRKCTDVAELRNALNFELSHRDRKRVIEKIQKQIKSITKCEY